MAAVSVAFAGGLLFASSMNWTHLGFAQSRPSASDVRPIADASNAFVSIADHVTPAVVSIQVEAKTPAQSGRNVPRGMIPPGFEDFFDSPQRPSVQEASGSGFIVSKDGYILTNNHVVTGMDHKTAADKITVQLSDRRSYSARIVGNDPTTDIAVIKIDGKDLPTATLGNDAAARVGEWVLAIGNPLGLDFTVTAGIVSAKGRSLPGLLGGNYSISDLIQTDAAINPGNSGGPLVNSRGEVIGVNSAIASSTGYYSGYGFAIPITLAKRVMDDLIAHGKVRFGVLGVSIRDVDANTAAVAGLKTISGVMVNSFIPDNDANSARKAGVEPGDVIVAVDGQDVDRVSALQRIVRTHTPGESVKLDIYRYGAQKSISVKLMERPSDSDLAANPTASQSESTSSSGSKLGITLRAIPAGQKPAGVPSAGALVADVEPLGPSADRLAPNDIITGVMFPKRQAVASPADLEEIVSKIPAGQYIQLKVVQMTQSGPQTAIVSIRVGGK